MKIIDINEKWLFTKENNPTNTINELKNAKLVTIPHCWNAGEGHEKSKEIFKGKCWYQKKYNVSEEDLKKFTFLEIGAAGNVSEVYINGQLAGGSKCGYAMYRVSLNGLLKLGENIISIMVDNNQHDDVYPLMADFTFYGGLYRYVRIIVTDAVHFDLLDNGRDGVYLTQKYIDNNNFELNIKGRVINESSLVNEAKIKFKLYDKEEKVIFSKTLDIEVYDKFEFNLTEEILDVTLWNGIENPYLYKLKVQLIYDNEVYDFRNIEIGFRNIEITPDRGLVLNGKPIKINGVSRHQDFDNAGNALTKENMDLDMSLIKEIGANSLRLSHYQHNDYFYSLCDREGLLVWAEIPFISIPSTIDEDNKNAKEQLEMLIKQVYNHCSVYCWGVQNEITIAVENESIYEKVKELEKLAKSLDSSRFTAQANIYSVADESPLNEITDMVGYNLYYGWYYKEMKDLGKRLDEFHKSRPNIPFLVSEYGVDTNPKFHSYNPTVKDYTEEYQIMFHDNAIKSINERPFVLGGYQWSMFDFGSDSRDEGGEYGKNLKGLVTIDRKIKKDAFYLYKANWSKEPFVHLAGKRFINRHQESNDIIVLSNLKNIKIFNGKKIIDEINNSDATKTFKDVKLSLGENILRAEGYDDYGNIYIDEMIINGVNEIDKSYELVKVEEEKHVVNWFEKFDLSNIQEITLKEGYFSTFDTIKELYGNEEAKEIFKKYFGDTAEHPRYKTVMEMTSINAMAKVSRFNIPKELLTVINIELNNIPKNKI